MRGILACITRADFPAAKPPRSFSIVNPTYILQGFGLICTTAVYLLAQPLYSSVVVEDQSP